MYYTLYLSNLHSFLHRALPLSSDSFERLCDLPATVVTDMQREGDTDLNGCNTDVTEEVDNGRGYSITKADQETSPETR